MKARCISRLVIGYDRRFSEVVIEKGQEISYQVNDNNFIINDNISITRPAFFAHFKVTGGDDRMTYSDFEYILCNYIFKQAVLFPEEYSGVRHLIIQDWNHDVIMITINKLENIVRASFKDEQQLYSSYEEAIEGIKAKYTQNANPNEVKVTIKATMKARWVDDFCSMLKYMERCGKIGHSSIVGFYADGDGDFRPKFEIDHPFENKTGFTNKDKELPRLGVLYDAG